MFDPFLNPEANNCQKLYLLAVYFLLHENNPFFYIFLGKTIEEIISQLRYRRDQNTFTSFLFYFISSEKAEKLCDAGFLYSRPNRKTLNAPIERCVVPNESSHGRGQIGSFSAECFVRANLDIIF